MYGYGYRYSIRPGYVPFNPLTDIDGLQLYLNKNTNVNTKIAADFTVGSGGASLNGALYPDLVSQNLVSGQFWMKRDGIASTKTVLGCWNVLSNMNWKVTIDTSFLRLWISENNTTSKSITTTLPSISTWSCVSFYINGTTGDYGIRLNGNAFATGTFTPSFVGAANLRIGRESGSTVQSYEGGLDSVNFWDRILTNDEFDDLYNSGSGLAYGNFSTSLLVDYLDGLQLNEAGGSRYSINGVTFAETGIGVGYESGFLQEVTESGELVWNWIDQSSNSFVFKNDTVTKQPLLSANSIDFDGTDDSLDNSTANVFSGDSSGIVFFSGYFDNTTTTYILNSADNATDLNYFAVGIRSTGTLFANANIGGTNNFVASTNAVTNGAYYYGYVKSNGSTWEINLNGTIESKVLVVGVDAGQWFSSVSSRDSLSLSSLNRLSPLYGVGGINKIIYSNDYTIDTTPILNFLSNPDN